MYAGLRAAGVKADLSLVVADAPAAAAGVFTKNVMCAAPVTYCKDVLAKKNAVKAVSTAAGRGKHDKVSGERGEGRKGRWAAHFLQADPVPLLASHLFDPEFPALARC